MPPTNFVALSLTILREDSSTAEMLYHLPGDHFTADQAWRNPWTGNGQLSGVKQILQLFAPASGFEHRRLHQRIGKAIGVAFIGVII